MSVTSAAVRDLAATITRQLDADNDGKLSSTEFEGFLSQLLGGLQNKPVVSGGPSTTSLFSVASSTPERRPVGNMAGFDARKLADVGHDTTKYRMARIFQFHPNTPAGLRDALPEIQQIVPGAKIIGSKGDKIDFGDYVDPRGIRIGVIDVIQASGLGGTAWQWLPVEEPSPAPASAAHP